MAALEQYTIPTSLGEWTHDMSKLIEVYNEELKFLSMKEVCKLTGYSRTHIYRLQAQGRFPLRVKMSPARVGIRLTDYKVWFHSLPHASSPISDEKGE